MNMRTYFQYNISDWLVQSTTLISMCYIRLSVELEYHFIVLNAAHVCDICQYQNFLSYHMMELFTMCLCENNCQNINIIEYLEK